MARHLARHALRHTVNDVVPGPVGAVRPRGEGGRGRAQDSLLREELLGAFMEGRRLLQARGRFKHGVTIATVQNPTLSNCP